MKAYLVYVRGDLQNCAYVGAATPGKAKAAALKTTSGRRLIDLNCRRAPELDDIAEAGPLSSAEALDTYDCECWGIPVRF